MGGGVIGFDLFDKGGAFFDVVEDLEIKQRLEIRNLRRFLRLGPVFFGDQGVKMLEFLREVRLGDLAGVDLALNGLNQRLQFQLDGTEVRRCLGRRRTVIRDRYG